MACGNIMSFIDGGDGQRCRSMMVMVMVIGKVRDQECVTECILVCQKWQLTNHVCRECNVMVG